MCNNKIILYSNFFALKLFILILQLMWFVVYDLHIIMYYKYYINVSIIYKWSSILEKMFKISFNTNCYMR